MIESRAPTPGGLSGIREVVRFVNRQKFIIFVPAVLIAGIAGTIASVTVPRYTATAALTLDVGKVQFVEHEVVSPLPLENSTSGASSTSSTRVRLTTRLAFCSG